MFLISQVSYGQGVSGTIVGTITDSTGAVVPGAAVVLTNTGTSDQRTEKTDKSGNYQILNLPPGHYKADVELVGFKHFTRQPIVLDVGGSIRIDIPMELGQITEVVTVTADSPLLQVNSASLSQVVTPQTVQEMPLNGRNVLNLLNLTPGVVPQTGTSGSSAGNGGTAHTNYLGWNNFQIGGGLPGQSVSFYDGAPVNGLGGNVVQLILTQDAVDEFRVVSNSVSAEFGRFGGGVINYTTKSGKNSVHGYGYEYFRNKALNASTFFNKRNGTPKPAYNQHQFGGVIGGPIKKDKIFFFGSYEQYKIMMGQPAATNVPTALEKQGDFSTSLTTTSLGINPCDGTTMYQGQIFDPLTTQTIGGVVCRTAFAGNKIPSSRWDVASNVVANVLKYFPDPNSTQSGSNFVATRAPGTTDKQGTIRGDAILSSKQTMFARYTYWTVADIPLNTLGNLTGSAGGDQKTHSGVLGDTYFLTPTTTLDFRLSVLRGFADDANQNVGQDLSKFGPAWGTLGSQVTYRELPTPVISGLFGFTGMPNISRQLRDTVAFTPSISLVKGAHTLKIGADLRLEDFNYIQARDASGIFNFDNAFTAANGASSSKSGKPFASFLLGYSTSGTITAVHGAGQFSRYQAYYVTDTWQAMRKLTLSLGLRWEMPGAFMERKDLGTVLNPTGTNSLGTVGGIATKGRLDLVNSPSWTSRGTEKVRHMMAAPRVGMSYNANAHTVISAGWGLTYLPHDLYNGAMPYLSPINSATNTMVTSVNNAGLIPLNTFGNPFPLNGVTGTTQQSIIQPQGRSTTYLDSLNGLSISGPVPNVRLGYAQQWNVSLQREIYGGALLTVAYAGSRGTFLPLGGNINVGSINNLNQLPNQYQSLGTALATSTTNPFAGLLNSRGALNGAKVSAGQLLRPYPQFTNVIQANAKGDNIYHSMQVSFQKRFNGGGVISSNYTWAKNIGTVSGNLNIEGAGAAIQDFTNLPGERALTPYNVQHRFVTSFVKTLPFGHGQKYLNNTSKVLGGVVSGWQLSGIVTLQRGFPLMITSLNNALTNSFGAGTIRPNRVAGCNPVFSGTAQSRLSSWFNTACFTAPSNYSFGDAPRTDSKLRGAGIADYNLSVNKSTGITEKVHLELRMELFNLFNRVQFGTPTTQLGNANFGIVTSAGNQPRQMQVAGRIVF